MNLGKREVAPHLPCEDVGETARLPFDSVFTDTAEAWLQESSMRDAAAEPGTQEEPHWPSKPGISPRLLAWLETRLRHPPLFAFHTSRDFLPQRCSLEEVGSLPVKISQHTVTVLRIQSPYYKLQGSVSALPHPMNSLHTLSSTFFHCPQSRMPFSHDSTLPDTGHLFIWSSLVKYLRVHQLYCRHHTPEGRKRGWLGSWPQFILEGRHTGVHGRGTREESCWHLGRSKGSRMKAKTGVSLSAHRSWPVPVS